MNKINEIREELRMVLDSRGGIIDTLVPLLFFVFLNAVWDFHVALWGALGIALVFALYRLFKRQAFLYAFGGILSVAAAALATLYLGRAEGFYIPSILSGGLTIILCLVSVLVKRPVVAFTSYITRRWPLQWYWHPRVRPAYTEVTWMWFAFFTIRFFLQFSLYQNATGHLLGVFQLLMGWPATIVLLIVSYVYGSWRLKKLEGPSTKEFVDNAPPPWEGQSRGF
jgi:hypothetical protein